MHRALPGSNTAIHRGQEGKKLQDFEVLVLKFQASVSQLTWNRRENFAGFQAHVQGFNFEVSGLNSTTHMEQEEPFCRISSSVSGFQFQSFRLQYPNSQGAGGGNFAGFEAQFQSFKISGLNIPTHGEQERKFCRISRF